MLWTLSLLDGTRDPWQELVEQMKLFAGFEPHCLTRGYGDLGASPRIASDAGLARFDGKHAKTTEFDAVAGDQRLLHALENSIHRSLCFCAWKAGAFNNPLY